MPFKETCALEERIAMMREFDSGVFTVGALCQRYKICRETFYACGDILKRAGLVSAQRRRRRPVAQAGIVAGAIMPTLRFAPPRARLRVATETESE